MKLGTAVVIVVATAGAFALVAVAPAAQKPAWLTGKLISVEQGTRTTAIVPIYGMAIPARAPVFRHVIETDELRYVIASGEGLGILPGSAITFAIDNKCQIRNARAKSRPCAVVRAEVIEQDDGEPLDLQIDREIARKPE